MVACVTKKRLAVTHDKNEDYYSWRHGSKHWAWAVSSYIGLEKFYSAYNVRLGRDTMLGMVDEEPLCEYVTTKIDTCKLIHLIFMYIFKYC